MFSSSFYLSLINLSNPFILMIQILGFTLLSCQHKSRKSKIKEMFRIVISSYPTCKYDNADSQRYF